MGAPAVAASALANTRTGRRSVVGVLAAIGLLTALILTPLWMIPIAIAGQNITAPPSDHHGPPAATGEWGLPLPVGYSTGRGFGWNPVHGCAYCPSDHKGYDMSQGCGAIIYAASGGQVINAGAMPGWGNTVRIDHGDGVISLYGHMQWDSLLVDVGDEVDIGTPLGLEGSTGKSTGCHLHFEIQVHGIAIDPEPFMADRGLPLR